MAVPPVVSHRIVLQSLLACFALVSIAGCGGDSALVPLEGTVTLDGQPLADATVALTPTTAAGPGPFSAKTDAAGKFSLGPSGAPGSGAEVGRYFLSIATVGLVEYDQFDQPINPQKEVVPPEFSSGTYRLEVPEGGDKEANFDLKSR